MLVEEYFNQNSGLDGANLFISEFFSIFKEDGKALEIFEKEILKEGLKKFDSFSINSEAMKFSTFINKIFGLCEFFTVSKF